MEPRLSIWTKSVVVSATIYIMSLTLAPQVFAYDLLRASDDKVYTLYRSSMAKGALRVHVATFDADEPAKYNRGNCEIAKQLFQNQPGVNVRYWCEKDYYKK